MRLRPPSSLRVRLALWYLLVFGPIQALFGGAIYLEVRGSLLSGVDAALQARAETVASQASLGPDGVQYQGIDVPNAEAETAVYLFDTGGRMRDRVAGSTELPPQPSLLRPSLAGRPGVPVTVQGQRVYTAPLRDEQGRLIGAVQVAQSLDAVDTQIQHLLTTLLLATPALLTLATAGGLFLAGRTLAPIDRITRTARAIGAGNLTGRLGLRPRDDEVGRLAATFDEMLDRLQRAFAHQERAMAQQRQFAADASHELRTPLTVIRSDLDVLLRRRRTPEEYEEVVRGVTGEVTHLGRLVEDLLTLARADSGQAELAREFVYLDTLIEEVATGTRRLAEAKGVALELHLARDVALLGDPTRLRQLILNLLSNAVTYTPAGGRVTLTLLAPEGWARLEVADTGIGIAPADLPHVFDRFFRADDARTHAASGTGLGLAIARWCAAAHGGRIDVRSRLGAGSLFTALLPLAPIDDDYEHAPADGPGGGSPAGCERAVSPAMTGPAEHLLVVEDDELLAAILRDGLTRSGYTVDVVGDGAAASPLSPPADGPVGLPAAPRGAPARRRGPLSMWAKEWQGS